MSWPWPRGPPRCGSETLNALRRFAAREAILLVLAGLFLICAVFVPSFFTARNLVNILKQCSIIGIVVAGLTITVIAGNVDLSVGSIAAFAAVVALTYTHVDLSKTNISMTVQEGAPLLVLVLGLPIVIGLAVGFLNGLVVARFNANSVIITLGMLSAVRGGALLFSGGKVIYGVKLPILLAIGQSQLAGVPVYVFIYLGITLLLEALLQRTVFGRHVFLIGTNPKAAEIAGVPVGRVRTLTFVLSGLTAALAALILAARLNTASGLSGNGWEFDAVTAAVIGGTSLLGGRGSVIKSLQGTVLVTMILNAMVLLNIPSPWQYVAKALIIVSAVWIDIRTRKEQS
jgi:ribose/xylose/arabinose/galactoside ABC-type transport system permease subunit